MKICTTCSSEWPDDQKFCPNDGSALRSAAKTADLVGSVIADRYHITKKLGEGGMGAVYLGEHVKMGRKSAIKVMSTSMANDPDSIARFNREAANAARINHPNVCAIYDFGEAPDGVIYLAMEFIEGEALSDLIKREHQIPAPRAAKIIRQAGEALQTAHDMSIVHRDLKPDNIMIAQGREGDIVKVVDFGIAKAMGPEEGQNVTKTGLVVGTPEYMSPEQLSGDQLDGRSDLYSLALVFYRMLTGTLPFKADSAQEMMIKRLTDAPLPLAEVMPEAGFPPQLQAVLDKALSRMPSERYDSAAAFAKDAEAAVSGMPAGAEDDGATQLIDAASAGAAATEQIAATRVGGAASTAPTAETPTPDTAQPAPSPTVTMEPAKRPSLLIAAGVVVALAAAGTGAAVIIGGNAEPDSTAGVTGDTAATVATTDSGQAGNTPTGNRRPQTDPPVEQLAEDTTTPPVVNTVTVDTVALVREIGQLSRDYDDPATLPAARTRAVAIYDDPNVPPSIRALAAANVAESYFVEDRTAELCQWIRRAVGLDPGNDNYRNFANQQGCQ